MSAYSDVQWVEMTFDVAPYRPDGEHRVGVRIECVFGMDDDEYDVVLADGTRIGCVCVHGSRMSAAGLVSADDPTNDTGKVRWVEFGDNFHLVGALRTIAGWWAEHQVTLASWAAPTMLDFVPEVKA